MQLSGIVKGAKRKKIGQLKIVVVTFFRFDLKLSLPELLLLRNVEDRNNYLHI